MSVAIKVNNVVKKFGDNVIIPGMSVNIKNGEFFTLLGPSGCGKTTLLRMIAGFNSIEGGEICFDDKVINDMPAHKRNIGMVFQSYAIFPHMTVRENVEYGLKLRKVNKAEMKEKTDDILDVVKITEYQERLPERLSGGQQQRVALARAIVIHPNVLLMDEPLSNLDAKLRVEMRSAIRDIQKKVGITTVYVTHDQEEALSVSDRIAVINKGEIQQIGQPHDIYARPANQFVSTFIGHSNLFKGNIKIDGEEKSVVFKNGYKVKMDNLSDEVKEGQEIVIAVRPEEFSISDEGIETTIKTSMFLGKYTNYEIDAKAEEIVSGMPALEFSQDVGHALHIYQVGEKIVLKPNAKKINIFTKDGKKSLIKGVDPYAD
ncbi:polyamine ABC transporter ATP-binding protein [Fusobacterium ulcerans]|uniref:Spermidine/putrescine import ATP-binding protein PotA n=1 Tax=Fusobacterium ulcerans TaxID=861 RepID=A0AAX2JCH7_9FUSO|nr:ABC transporter ATP-binding protein [Fusobacterium ulcerans]AVQ26956.1 polyamine ABC transporter ATP-binding protein [Fusobacterium ulcerans]SQJ09665.1 Spermidine/putrescine import ATP-binding protein PotA [Fusobacterium ulcerans]